MTIEPGSQRHRVRPCPGGLFRFSVRQVSVAEEIERFVLGPVSCQASFERSDRTFGVPELERNASDDLNQRLDKLGVEFPKGGPEFANGLREFPFMKQRPRPMADAFEAVLLSSRPLYSTLPRRRKRQRRRRRRQSRTAWWTDYSAAPRVLLP